MKQNTFSVDFIIGLLLFCVFAGSMLMVLVSGAGAYNDIRNELEAQYSERTCVSYISAKIRHYDHKGAVFTDRLDGINAIMLHEEESGTEYITYIYCYDGYMRELYCEKDLGFNPESGLPVIAADSLSVSEEEDSLIKIECESKGRMARVYISLCSGKEAFI